MLLVCLAYSGCSHVSDDGDDDVVVGGGDGDESNLREWFQGY